MDILFWPLYPLYLIAGFVVRILPPRLGHALAWFIGSVGYLILPQRRRVMGANYAPVLGCPPGDPKVRRVGRLALRNFVLYLYDFLAISFRTVEEIDQRVTLHLTDHFAEARARNKGMIYVSAHFGNMDYAGVAAARHIVPMTVVADMVKPKVLMDRMVDVRGKKGLNVVYLAKAPRAVLTALRKNEAVAFLLDVGCNRDNAIPVTFFGHRTMFPAGPALLSLRTGAPIVVGYGLVVGDRIEAYSYPPIYAVSTGDKAADAQRCSQMIVEHFEDFIRRYPEQWYIFRPMWGPEEEEPSLAPDGQAHEPLPQGA